VGEYQKQKYIGLNTALVCSWGWARGSDKDTTRTEKGQSRQPGNHSQTPLSCAAWNAREGVVKIVLEREEVNPDRRNKWNQIPLSHAIQNGYEMIVALLQSRKAVTPSTFAPFEL